MASCEEASLACAVPRHDAFAACGVFHFYGLVRNGDGTADPEPVLWNSLIWVAVRPFLVKMLGAKRT